MVKQIVDVSDENHSIAMLTISVTVICVLTRIPPTQSAFPEISSGILLFSSSSQ